MMQVAAAAAEAIDSIELRLLLDAIHARFHYDFRNYAMPSLERRVRAAMSKVGCATFSSLQDRLLRDPTTFPTVLAAMTVVVSDMFRDPPFFAVFRNQVVPELARHPSARVWVAGCATGEEAYSVAIILAESGLLERTRIYATDISETALAIAQAGVYPTERVAGFSRNHRETGARCALSEHYSVVHDAAVFDSKLRDRILFCDHSLATDAVFAAVDVVICRNVLIYFDATLQARALDLFHDALDDGGFLGLGSTETVRGHTQKKAFHSLSAEHRWFRL